MKRRSFFKQATLATLGGTLMLPQNATGFPRDGKGRGRRPENIIFLVSDGMSSGTLAMADIFAHKKYGRGSHWLDLYRDNRVKRALMDMASASASVTDSAAASSSWGGGFRVVNGHLNVGANGEKYLPIWQKMKSAGKKAGCVTTVPVTHATPAGFCISIKSRSMQEEIASMYLDLKFDVMMGGGSKYFTRRKDGKNLLQEYVQQGFQVVESKKQLETLTSDKPVMALFGEEGLPYELDRIHDKVMEESVPSLAEMTMRAIDLMKDHKKGFVLQVEGGKVDWAAHANDAPALLYDQLAFDEAVRVAIDFAESDGNTLVVITTDHGNANPGLYYGSKSDEKFESLFRYTRTNDWVLRQTKNTDSVDVLTNRIKEYQGYSINAENAETLLKSYQVLPEGKEYDEYKLPFKEYGLFQAEFTNVAFGGMDHTADFSELAMFGPGSELLPDFIKNTDLHHYLLKVAGIS